MYLIELQQKNVCDFQPKFMDIITLNVKTKNALSKPRSWFGDLHPFHHYLSHIEMIDPNQAAPLGSELFAILPTFWTHYYIQ